MKKQNHFLSITLGILAAFVVFGNQAGLNLPLMNNEHTALVTLGFLGIVLCAQGIGRIMEDKRWTHPISLLGVLIGAAILILWIGRLLNFQLPFAATDQQAILTVGALMGGKFILARFYALVDRFPRTNQNRA